MQPPKKILILRFSSIGDIVLTSALVRCLKKELPDSEVHYATKSRYASIVKNNPNIDKIHLLSDSLPSLIRKLRRENFDFIVDLHKNLRTLLIKAALLKRSASFPKQNFRKFLLIHFKMHPLQTEHVVDRYFQAVKKLGVRNDGKGLDFFIPSEDRLSLRELPESHRSDYVAVVIAATYTTKRFPETKLLSVIDRLKSPVILIGGPAEKEMGQRIADARPGKVFNACGKYNLEQSAWLLQHARKVLSNDTGMMHIAAALQKQISLTWGNTVPAFGMSPYFGNGPGREYRFEVKDLPCRPCSKLGYEKCPKNHFRCMMDQDEEAIASSLRNN